MGEFFSGGKCSLFFLLLMEGFLFQVDMAGYKVSSQFRNVFNYFLWRQNEFSKFSQMKK